MKIKYLTLILFFALIVPAKAAMPQNTAISEFVKANQAYRDGKYTEAIKSYEAIIDGGLESGPLYYNLANSYFKAGQTGQAVLNYERARKMTPRDSDLQTNEKFVLYALPGGIPQSTNLWEKIWEQHSRFYTSNEMILIVTIILFLLAGAHILGFYLNWPSARAFWVRGILGILLLVYGTGLWVKADAEKNISIVVKATSARFEPNDKATVYFELSDGQRVKGQEQEGDWQKIERPDGKLGWVPKNSIERL